MKIKITIRNVDDDEFTFEKQLHLGNNLKKNAMKKVVADLLLDEQEKLENAVSIELDLFGSE